MSDLQELKSLIESECNELMCEIHPEVCSLRDHNYPKLEGLLIDQIFKGDEPVSVQTAIAELEQELSHV
jgi:hypothetical protein